MQVFALIHIPSFLEKSPSWMLNILLWVIPRLFIKACLYPLNIPESASVKAETQTEEVDKGRDEWKKEL